MKVSGEIESMSLSSILSVSSPIWTERWSLYHRSYRYKRGVYRNDEGLPRKDQQVREAKGMIKKGIQKSEIL